MKLRLYVIKTETILAIGMHESERGRYVFFDFTGINLPERGTDGIQILRRE